MDSTQIQWVYKKIGTHYKIDEPYNTRVYAYDAIFKAKHVMITKWHNKAQDVDKKKMGKKKKLNTAKARLSLNGQSKPRSN